MLADWVYDNPTWLVGSVIVVLSVLLSLVGLTVVHRLVPLRLRKTHNELVGFIIAVVGVAYAVLLAFIAVATWETFKKSDVIVASEANYLGDVFRDTTGLPDDLARELRGHLIKYVDTVMEEEWPAQREGRVDQANLRRGWAVLGDFHVDIARFRPANAGEAVIQAELLRSLSNLYDARRGRLLAAREHVSAIVWWIIGLGGVLTVGFACLFGPGNFTMHAVVTGLLAAMLALVVVLIVDQDYPFRGTPSISDEAFRVVKHNMEAFEARHR
jgi:hypothetical protein